VAAYADRLLVVALIWGTLTFGAVYPWAYWPLALGSAALGVWAVRHTHALRDLDIRNIGLAFTLVAIAIALQLAPLPYATVMTLSPGVDRVLRASSLGYVPPPSAPLSLAPGSTAAALGIFLAAVSIVIGWSIALVRRRRLENIMRSLIWFGAALAVFGVIQKPFLDADHPLVYGFWPPLAGGEPFGPFINRNHFAGWMVMVVPLALAYAAARIAEAPIRSGAAFKEWLRWAVAAESGQFLSIATAVLVMGMSVALTGSRSGMGALAVALGVFGVLAALRVPDRRSRLTVIAIMAVLLLAVIAWAGVGAATQRFAQSGGDLPERVRAWRETIDIVGDFKLFGVGLGGYGTAMLVYQQHARDFIYLQAHNDYLQLWAEGGLLVGIPALTSVILTGIVMRRRWKEERALSFNQWARIGALAGLAGIASQSLVEFSLQMPANTLLCAVLIAIALQRGDSAEPSIVSVHSHANRV
jgi:O-antigen ligase